MKLYDMHWRVRTIMHCLPARASLLRGTTDGGASRTWNATVSAAGAYDRT